MKISAISKSAQPQPKVVEDTSALSEVNMSPSVLAQFAKDADKYGVRAGFEAELLFTKIGPRNDGGDDGEALPDYENYDVAIRNHTTLDQLQDFFSEVMSRNNPVWGRMEEAYLDGVYEEAQKFVDENIDERVRERVLDEIAEDERLYNYLTSNGHSDEDIEKIIAAGDDAPRFTRSSEQQAYANENPLYKFWQEAQDAVEEELESEMDRMRDEVENELRDEFMSDNDYYIGQWLKDNDINSMSNLANEYELAWPYWTDTNTEFEAFDEADMAYAAEDLKELLGIDVRVSGGYHKAARNDSSYIIEPDGSLEPDDPEDHGSAEVISPPMPLDQMIDHVKKVIQWSKSYGGYTNKKCGLHVGVSLPDMSKVDYVKLALLMGDEYVLKTFGREMNTYCESVFKKIAGNRNEQTIAQAIDALKTGMIGVASTALKYSVFKSTGTTEKFVSANWKNQYIEFRSMGGDYIDNIDKIVNTVYRYVRALVSAADPEMDRKEYISKLYKLVQKANEDIAAPDSIEPVNMLITKYLAGQLDKQAISKYTQYFKQAAVSRTNPNAEKPAHPAGQLQRWRIGFPGRGIEIIVKARNADRALAIARKENSIIARADDNQLSVTSMGVVNTPAPNNNTALAGSHVVNDFTSQDNGSSSGEFTGWWKILDANDQELHRFNGLNFFLGNSQADANRVAAGWVAQNRPDQAGQDVAVVPVMN